MEKFIRMEKVVLGTSCAECQAPCALTKEYILGVNFEMPIERIF